MTADNQPILDYIAVKKSVLDYFQCDGDYYIKPLPDARWSVRYEEDFFILSYWIKNGIKLDSVIVKKGGKPMIYKTQDHTLIVGIDCVKIAFIFSNSNKAIDSR